MRKAQLTIITTSIVFIEWVEYSLYLYLGAAISHSLLPKELGHNALLITFSIFAISYLARPLGALFFGLYSDYRGRKQPLLFSAFFIGIATIAIGLIPSYQTIGILAPILLLGFRLIQSFAISGEFNNSAIFLMEHTPKKQVLAGSFIGFASSLGMFIGGIFAALVGSFQSDLSWRSAYIIVGILTFIFMLLRTKLQESPIFLHYIEQLKTHKSLPFMRLLKQYKLGLLKIAAVASFMSVYIYTCNFFFISYLQTNNGFSLSNTTLIAATVQGLVTLLTPIFALATDKIHFKSMYRFGVITLAIMAPTLFIGAHLHNNLILIIGFILYIIGNGILTAVVFKLMYDFLPAEIRCTGTSFTWSLSAAMLGSTAPILATYFINDLDAFYLPAIYVMLLAIFAYIASFSKQSQH
ncbi:MFS transporter [Thiotrichales bacterium 19S3-7]|nr:MFS transporter [Thiotrichales bacterium 19S3-7]MCF6801743.1 MFS transporter [Thiotrichales bacterium 19S3-11]